MFKLTENLKTKAEAPIIIWTQSSFESCRESTQLQSVLARSIKIKMKININSKSKSKSKSKSNIKRQSNTALPHQNPQRSTGTIPW